MDEVEDLGYQPPVLALLGIGAVDELPEEIDYVAEFGLSEEDIPELIRLVLDEEFWSAEDDTLETWASIHAWRALGQLRATAAIPALMQMISLVDDTLDYEWIALDVPQVLVQIGPDALPALQEFLGDPKNHIHARTTAISAIQEMAEAHPESRTTCVEILTNQLRHFDQQSQPLNGFLIAALAELNAVESAEVMEAAFAANQVDLSINGDWEEVQVELGLLPERITPPPPGGWLQFGDFTLESDELIPRVEMRMAKAQQNLVDAKRKKARKQAKATKKKQRSAKKRKRK